MSSTFCVEGPVHQVSAACGMWQVCTYACVRMMRSAQEKRTKLWWTVTAPMCRGFWWTFILRDHCDHVPVLLIGFLCVLCASSLTRLYLRFPNQEIKIFLKEILLWLCVQCEHVQDFSLCVCVVCVCGWVWVSDLPLYVLSVLCICDCVLVWFCVLVYLNCLDTNPRSCM